MNLKQARICVKSVTSSRTCFGIFHRAKIAFTLAEVLITLGVIGVVA